VRRRRKQHEKELGRREVLLFALSCPAISTACQDPPRRRTPPPEPEPEPEPEPKPDPKALVEDEALGLADLPSLRAETQPVLYLVPVREEIPLVSRRFRSVKSTRPGMPEPQKRLRWLLSWATGTQFEEWKLLPLFLDDQIRLLQRLHKKHPRKDGAPIQTVLAYDSDMGLDDIGAMDQVLKETSAKVPRRYFHAYLAKTEWLKLTLPEDLSQVATLE